VTQFVPAEMQSGRVVAPDSRIRDVLVEVADAGVFEPDPGDPGTATSRVRSGSWPTVCRSTPTPSNPGCPRARSTPTDSNRRRRGVDPR
jgi:hypothetical protein